MNLELRSERAWGIRKCIQMVESCVNDIMFCGNGNSWFDAKYCLEVAVSSGFSIITAKIPVAVGVATMRSM